MEEEKSPTVAETDQQVKELLSEIRHELAKEPPSDDALKALAQQLREASKPAHTMELLAPLLFCDGMATQDELSSQEALTILGWLVSVDRSSYLQPASLAVRNETLRLASSDSADENMVVSPGLLQVMVSQLSGNDVQVSAYATEALVACCQKNGPVLAEAAINAIAQAGAASLSQLSVNKQNASTVGVRCASAVVDIACLDDANMRSAVDALNTLVLPMLTDASDPLLQMSALDMVEKLATTLPMHHARAAWLFTEPVLQPLLTMAGAGGGDDPDDDEDPDPILGGTALRVVAALCKVAHSDLSVFQNDDDKSAKIITSFHRALHNFETSGELDRLALVDAISSFASASADALELVLTDPVTREAWLSLKVAQPKLKSVILTSVAMLIDPTLSTGTTNDSSVGTSARLPSASVMKLYVALGQTNGDDTTNLVLALTRSPLAESRLGAYALLGAVAKLTAGCQLLLAHPEFFDFLVDRDREKTKLGREAKYEIVRSIVDSEVKGLLADDIVRQLEEYVKQGPHYVKALSWELATE